MRRSLIGSLQDTFDESNTEYYAGVVFSYPLERREADSAYEKAEKEKAKALVELKKIEKTIIADVDSKVKKLNAYRERAREYIDIAELQRYKLEEENKKYRYGRSSSDTIIRFQEDYLNAELQRFSASLDYMEALIDLYLCQDVYLQKRGLAAE